MPYAFTLPRKVLLGRGALQAGEFTLRSMGKKAFIVSGPNVSKLGSLDGVTEILVKNGIEYVVFTEITGEPTVAMIDAGLARYRAESCDFIIAIGGGSPLDSGKAIAAMSVLEGKISDYMGKDISGDFPPMVMIPTTAGTGSETTKFTIITDEEKDVKMLLKGEDLLPDLAIIDPVFTLTAPGGITAATGMDALTHAIEAFTSRKANPQTDMYALSAIRKIFTYLPEAFFDGSDAEAREGLAIAAFEAGVCINNASVTLVHGMSRPIGALFHVPHGISNAMLLKECLSYVMDGCLDKFADMARAIGAADASVNDEKAAKAFLTKLEKLCSYCQIPSLKEYGINKSEFDRVKGKMAKDAIASGSPGNTIKDINTDDLITIYNRLW